MGCRAGGSTLLFVAEGPAKRAKRAGSCKVAAVAACLRLQSLVPKPSSTSHMWCAMPASNKEWRQHDLLRPLTRVASRVTCACFCWRRWNLVLHVSGGVRCRGPRKCSWCLSRAETAFLGCPTQCPWAERPAPSPCFLSPHHSDHGMRHIMPAFS
jgi:hypothetical protein